MTQAKFTQLLDSESISEQEVEQYFIDLNTSIKDGIVFLLEYLNSKAENTNFKFIISLIIYFVKKIMNEDIKDILSEVYKSDTKYHKVNVENWTKVYNLSIEKLTALGETLPTVPIPVLAVNTETEVTEEVTTIEQEDDKSVTYTKPQILSVIIFICGLVCKIKGLPLPEDLVVFLNSNADAIMIFGGFLLMFVNKIFNFHIKLSKNE